MDAVLLDALRKVDTPTVRNAIEVVHARRGFAAFTRGTMVCTEPGRAVVGYAVTARIAATSPPTEPPEVIRARRLAYYRAMHEAPKPSIAVTRTPISPPASEPSGASSTPRSTRPSAFPAR